MSVKSPSSVFVGDLSFFCQEVDLYQLFRPFGEILRITIVRGREGKGKKSSFYGFVDYCTMPSAQRAIATLNNQLFLGRLIVVNSTETVAPKKTYRFWHKLAVSFAAIADQTVHEQFLRDLFERFGYLADVVVRDYQVQNSRHYSGSAPVTEVNGYAFLYFIEPDAALRVVNAIRDADSTVALPSPLAQYHWIRFSLLNHDDPRLQEDINSTSLHKESRHKFQQPNQQRQYPSHRSSYDIHLRPFTLSAATPSPFVASYPRQYPSMPPQQPQTSYYPGDKPPCIDSYYHPRAAVHPQYPLPTHNNYPNDYQTRLPHTINHAPAHDPSLCLLADDSPYFHPSRAYPTAHAVGTDPIRDDDDPSRQYFLGANLHMRAFSGEPMQQAPRTRSYAATNYDKYHEEHRLPNDINSMTSYPYHYAENNSTCMIPPPGLPLKSAGSLSEMYHPNTADGFHGDEVHPLAQQQLQSQRQQQQQQQYPTTREHDPFAMMSEPTSDRSYDHDYAKDYNPFSNQRKHRGDAAQQSGMVGGGMSEVHRSTSSSSVGGLKHLSRSSSSFSSSSKDIGLIGRGDGAFVKDTDEEEEQVRQILSLSTDSWLAAMDDADDLQHLSKLDHKTNNDNSLINTSTIVNQASSSSLSSSSTDVHTAVDFPRPIAATTSSSSSLSITSDLSAAATATTTAESSKSKVLPIMLLASSTSPSSSSSAISVTTTVLQPAAPTTTIPTTYDSHDMKKGEIALLKEQSHAEKDEIKEEDVFSTPLADVDHETVQEATITALPESH